MKINFTRVHIFSIISGRWLSLLWVVVFLIGSHSQVSAQYLYGMTRSGGTSGGGTIFRTNNDGSGFATKYNFQIDANAGRSPDYCQMVLVNNKLYGMTSLGGKYDGGVLYEYTPDTGSGAVYTVKVDFDFQKGTNPRGSLVLASDGMLYGMTSSSGANYRGTLFQYNPTTGAFAKKIDFDGTNGAHPYGGLTIFVGAAPSSNKLYGMTYDGGTGDKGVLFEYDPSTNGLTKKIDFDGAAKGANPVRSLTMAFGRLYGMTVSGGTDNKGVLFQFEPNGVGYTKKIDFNGANGANPPGSLTVGYQGRLFGTTNGGGLNNSGILFEYDVNGTLTKIQDFDTPINTAGLGAYPGPALVVNPTVTNVMYGFCESGGAAGGGTQFTYNVSTGAVAKKHDFTGLDGFAPKGGMTAANGVYYGTAYGGGQTESGVIFRYDPNAVATPAYMKVLDFNLAANGAYPENTLVYAPNGKFYGTTPDGGANGWGVLFEFNPLTNTFTKKIDFDNAATKGANPFGAMAVAPNGKLYGMTFSGGLSNSGTLFEYDPASNGFTQKIDFGTISLSGHGPFGGLVLGANGNFYGMTTYGGSNALGALFEYVPGSTSITKRVDFGASTGSHPYGNLTLAANGKLLGLTSEGGSSDLGVLFEYVPGTSSVTSKVDFDGGYQGSAPKGSLVLASNGKFYGLTSSGGSDGFGTLFEFNYVSGQIENVVTLNGANAPQGALTAGAGGKLYGAAWFGGPVNNGNLFEYDPASFEFTVKQEFTGNNGAYPGYGALVAATVPLSISGFSPASGAVGTAVTIEGSAFDPNAANNVVYFGAIRATVITATNSALVVTVPPGATYQPITVTTNGLTAYSKLPFVVTFPATGALAANTFVEKLILASTPGSNPLNVAVGDFNGDGKGDLAVTNYGNNSVAVYPNTSGQGNVAFTTPAQMLTPVFGPRGIATGDLDGDGKLDLVVTNYSDNTLQIFRNNSTSAISFATQTAVPLITGALPFNVAIGDVDGDGKPEVAVTNTSSASISVLYNTSTSGNIAFGGRTEFTTATGPQGIAFGDLDADGKLDLVISNFSSSNISIFRNTSTKGNLNAGSFAARTDLATGGGPRTVALGDIDRDGNLDIVTANETAGTLSVFRNITLGAGAISVAGRIDIPGFSAAYTVAISDLDGDGMPELAGTVGNGAVVNIVKNSSTSGVLVFGSKFSPVVSSFPIGLAFTDVDGDGRNDFVDVATNTEAVNVFGNTIGFLAPIIGGFTPAIGYPTGSVTITGSNFDPIAANNIVKINNIIAVVDSASATLLRITVPLNATSGKIAVTSHGQTALSATDIAIDPNPPVIETPALVNVAYPVSSDVRLEVTVTDLESAVTSVDILYGPANGHEYTLPWDQHLTHSTGNLWTFDIPKDQFKDSGLQYEIRAYSGGGPSSLVFKIGLTYDNGGAGIQIPYTSGTTVASYKIIALPLELNAETVGDIFSDETSLGSPDKTKWRIFHYTGGANHELTATDQIKPGEGYWFIAASGSGFDTGTGNTVGSNSLPVSTPVVAGWNQIGNPYLFNLSVDDIVAYNSSLGVAKSSFKTYSNSFTSGPNQLDKFQGAFLMITGSGGDLVFPAEKNTGINGGRTKEPENTQNKNPLSDTNWEVMVNLTDSKHSLNFSGFGMNPQASLSFDKWDDFTVPRFLEYLELDHAKALHGAFYTKDVVPTAENYEWTFDVESSQEGMIEMTWDNTYFGDNDKQLVLWDVQQQIPINMREQNKYTVNPSSGKSFKVFYGGKEYVKEKATPDRMVFHSVFPNPSAGKFTFSFSTTARPEDKWVALEVFDVLGRKVTTITEGEYTPGYHEVSWDAVDNSGAVLTGGIYLTRLKNSATEIPKKIVLK